MANNSRIVNADGTTRELRQIWGKPTGTILAPMSTKAMSFDGDLAQNPRASIEISDQDDFSYTDGASDKPFSICAWAKLDKNNSYGPLVSKLDFDRDNQNAAANEWIFHTLDGKFGLFLYDVSTSNSGDITWKFTNAPVFSNSDTWHHVLATYDGRGGENATDGINLYVDGQLHAGPFQTRRDPGYSNMLKTTAPLTIATSYDVQEGGNSGDPNKRAFEGEIADIVIFNKELSALEVEEVYNNGAVKDMTTFSAYSSIVSWYRLGDADHPGDDGIKDSVSGYHGKIVGTAKIINAKNLKSDYVLKTI